MEGSITHLNYLEVIKYIFKQKNIEKSRTKKNYFLSYIGHRPKEFEFELQIYSNVYKLQLSFPPSMAQRK